MSYRLAVLVSGEGSNLQAILDQLHGRGGIEVACVASSRAGAGGLRRAEAAEVPAAVFELASYHAREERDRALADWIAGHGVDLVVLAGFMEILGPSFIQRFEGRVINVHPSLLPAFPGVAAVRQALEHGVKVTGVTVHFVDEGVDSGPIIGQRSLELAYPADIEAVEQRIHEIEHELLPRSIALLARGAVRRDPATSRQVLIAEGPDAGS